MSMTIGSQMILSTTSFEPGGFIPEKYTCDGVDISPQLSWSGAPAGTETYVIIVDDPDAPGGTFTHWVIFNIPANRTMLPEGVPAEKIVKKACSQAMNDFRMVGYGGPCPPVGKPHHYHFKLFALKKSLDVPSLMPRKAIEAAMRGYVLEQTEIVGLYQRKK